jgi:signal transduction histidine kinase
MSRAGDWRSGWADTGRRLAAAPHAPAVAGALLGLLAATESITRAAGTGASTQFALVLFLLALSTTLPLALLRPAGAAMAVSAASVLSLALFHTLTVAGLGAQLIVLYRLGRNGPERNGARLQAAGLAVPFLVLALAGPRPTDSEAGILTVLLASLAQAAAWAGIARRARSEALAHRAARQVITGTLLEHTARGQRARIARELHDVVAHHISMVAVQAETARLTTPGMPAAGAQRLSAIGDTARAALTEMRRLLGVLREDAQADVADRRPQPGLKQLNDLLDEARDASGTGTRLILRGPPVTLDPGVELAAYRIVQEALTNARRHAPGAAVDVELHYTDDALRLRIRDSGPGPPDSAPAGGHGLPGMRERAAAVGGQLRTGPAAGGGFLVEATLPAKAEVPG